MTQAMDQTSWMDRVVARWEPVFARWLDESRN